MSDFPLTSGRKKARFGGPYGNRIEIQVVSGEVLQDPEYGLFVARGVATFKVILHPASGFHALPALVERAAHNITINFADEPVKKLIVQGWFSNKPKRAGLSSSAPGYIEEKTEFLQAWARTADLDIDSDNNNGAGLSRSMDEDAQEAPVAGTSLGKLFPFCPALDTNINGVPDFADGFNVFGNAGDGRCREWPVAILFLQGFNETEGNPSEVRFEYPGSDPAGVTRTVQPDGTYKYSPSGGGLRIWTRNGPSSRLAASVPSGNYIKPGQAYHFLDLDDAKVAQGHWRFFLEPIGSSSTAADGSIEVWVDPYSQNKWVKVDHVSFTLLPVNFQVTNFVPVAEYLPDAVTNPDVDYFQAGWAGVSIPVTSSDVDVKIIVGTSSAPSLMAAQNNEATIWALAWIENMTDWNLKRTYPDDIRQVTFTDAFPLVDGPADEIPVQRWEDNFTANNQSQHVSFIDVPRDQNAYWHDPTGHAANPITEWYLTGTFITWLTAYRAGSNDFIFLKYVNWEIDHTATIDVSKPVDQRVTMTKRHASVVQQGEGIGPNKLKLVGPVVADAVVDPAY